jgi:hypothetical protein
LLGSRIKVWISRFLSFLGGRCLFLLLFRRLLWCFFSLLLVLDQVGPLMNLNGVNLKWTLNVEGIGFDF